MTTSTLSEAGSTQRAFDSPDAQCEVPRKCILILLNPGRLSRNFLLDLGTAAASLGLHPLFVELENIWATIQAGQRLNVAEFAQALKTSNVVAVLGYCANGLTEWGLSAAVEGRSRGLFETVGIPHLMFWTDHPQWANERFALRPDLQPVLASPNNFHFVKNQPAADEIRDLLGWPNCFGLSVAENPNRLRPSPAPHPEYDVVTITGAPPSLPAELEKFLKEDDPDVQEMRHIGGRGIQSRFDALWARQPADAPRGELDALGRAWVRAKTEDPLVASYRTFLSLESEFPLAAAWLRRHWAVYFDAIEALWLVGRWERTFVTRFLARYFRVGVFGSDWSSVGLGPGGWVGHDDQPRVYGSGRVALNVAQPSDEEGVAHKPFQIAACGVPMLHSVRKGLESLFSPGVEIMTFDSPTQARDQAELLLSDPSKARQMADRARERLCREHTWAHRLSQMLLAAGIPLRG